MKYRNSPKPPRPVPAPVVLILAALLLTGCATTEPPSPFPAGLQGMIYDNANNPVSGARLVLRLPPEPLYPGRGESEAADDPAAEAQNPEPLPEAEELNLSSDIEGRFLLPDLMPGVYSLEISCEGFEPQGVTIRFSDPGQVLYVRMTSLAFLRRQIEEALERRDFETARALFSRADAIDDNDPVLLYLKAVFAVLRKSWPEAEESISRLKEAGYSSKGLSGLANHVNQNLEEPIPAQAPEEETNEAE